MEFDFSSLLLIIIPGHFSLNIFATLVLGKSLSSIFGSKSPDFIVQPSSKVVLFLF